MKWLFNSNSLKLKNGKVTWDQARNFKGAKDDEVIFFDFLKGEGNFTSLYRIDEVSSTPQNATMDSRFDIEVTLNEEANYEEDTKELADYVYSFPRIKNFGSNLWRHFNRKYYRISELEFNAITKDDIFLSRTFLGSAVNALHVEHRRAFVLHVFESNPEYLFGKYNYGQLYEILQEYIDFAIKQPAKQLKAGFAQLVKIVGNSDAIDALFVSESVKDGNKISDQVKVISSQLEQIETWGSTDFPMQIQQEKFEKYFRNAPLPFNLN